MTRVLFLSPLPPPYYGSAMSSKSCLGIIEGAGDLEVKNIKLNYSKDVRDIGRITIDKIMGIFKVKKEIFEEIISFCPDIIYMVPATSSFGLLRDWIFTQQIKRYWQGKILFHVRSRILERDWNNRLKRKFICDIFKDQKVIILGADLEGDLHNLVQKKDVSILPNAIRNELSAKQLKKIMDARSKNEVLEILFLSNMDKEKGWPKLLDACKILNEDKINFKCNFVGPWRNKKDKLEFENFVDKNNLGKKIFSVGKKTGEEKNNYLKRADVLVFPTEYRLETFGRVILESYMFGIPVIANGIATIPRTVRHGRTGFLLKDNSGEEIAKYLEKLRNSKLREKLGASGRKVFLENYELNKYEKKFLTFFR